MTEPKPRVSVLTGAGASKPLGLPTMEALLPEGFERLLLDRSGETDVFDMATNWAAIQHPSVVDFEYVFSAVDMIAQLSPTDPVAMAFAGPRGSAGRFQFKQRTGSYIEANLQGYKDDAARVAEKLKQVVHERLSNIDNQVAARLYRGLFAFLSGIVGPAGVLDVFTTNYDRAVEVSYETTADNRASDFDFELVRGFPRAPRALAAPWNPGEYDRPAGNQFLVRLYKLHGSLNWRRENDVLIEGTADEYVGRNVVIYPVRKPVVSEPFRTLFDLFKRRLKESQLCVVIGSSLRDEYLRQVLVERLTADTLRLVLIDPNADEVASLLGKDLGALAPDRLGRLVQTANVRFGGNAEDLRDMEQKIRLAALDAPLPRQEAS